MALLNVTYLDEDAYLEMYNFLIESPVLQYLGVHTKTIHEERGDLRDVADCSTVKSTLSGTRGRTVSRMIIARLNDVTNYGFESVLQPSEWRSQVDHFKVRKYPDPFKMNLFYILSILISTKKWRIPSTRCYKMLPKMVSQR